MPTGEITILTGATFKGRAWEGACPGRLAADIGKAPVIRKLGPDELSLYWAMIPFDIQEPIYILEAGDKRFLLNLIADKDKFSVMWVDELSKIRIESPKAFNVTNILLYQPDDILATRLSGATELAGYIKQLQAVAGDFSRPPGPPTRST